MTRFDKGVLGRGSPVVLPAGVERPAPTPIWMQAFQSTIIKAVAVLALLILGSNIAEWTVRREAELQQQQKTMLRGVK